jgi:hypothetical protein
MAFGLKKKDDNAVVPQPEEQAALPPPIIRSKPAGGSSLGIGGICLIVAAVALLATIGGQFFAMKAMFLF